MSEEDEQASRPSRYRSLRRPPPVSMPATSSSRRATSSGHEPDQRNGAAAANSISRSMSRYRRRAASVAGETDTNTAQTLKSDINNTPPVPAIPLVMKTANTPTVVAGQTEPTVRSSARRPSGHAEARQRTTSQTADARDKRQNMANNSNHTQSAMAGQKAQHGSQERRDVSWEAERDRLLEEQKRKDLQRLEEELENSRRVKAQLHKMRSPVVEKFVLLAKGGKSSKEGTAPLAASARSSIQRSGPEQPVKAEKKAPPTHIEPGGRGIVPQKDAPTSAINAGDRNVKVRCQHQSLLLTITPDTTAVDIIRQSARKVLSNQGISPEKCVVVEQYAVLGLERRLRRYERIRDVMNSWDGDTQNQLAVISRDPNDNNEELDVSAVESSDVVPVCQLQLYHSNRPGKWNKRWITLLESGQIVSAKKSDAKTTDKDTASLCHLSDYDIYTLTESQLRRHIKPPKRFCFAIKSQHKTTLFLNTENYVQYFSTDDPQVAREFKQKTHAWRSRYLVDQRPEVRTKQSPQSSSAENPNNVASVNGHRLQAPVDETPYEIGQFEPLLDMTRFEKRLSQFGQDVLPPEPEPPVVKETTDRNIGRHMSLRKKPDHKPSQPPPREVGNGFTGGLLGEGYDNRKQELAELEKKKKRPQDLAFTEGPSLLNSQRDQEATMEQPVSPSWFPSALEHTAKQHSSPPVTGARTTSLVDGGSGRHFSLSAATRRPTGLTSSVTRPPTQHSSQHPYSYGQPNPAGSQAPSLSHSDQQRGAQGPLVDLTPQFREPPQWSKEGKGHGVKPPEGIGHLVNFISTGNGASGLAEPPPRGMIHRPTTSGAASVGRTRSMSAASVAHGRPWLSEAPPVPSLPSRLAREGSSSGRKPPTEPAVRDDRREVLRQRDRERERERQREREYREREAAYNAVPGRAGTLKVV